jgi:hypothetical protein
MVQIQIKQDIFLASYSVGGVKLTTNLYLVHRLRMSGAISLLPLYAFLVMEREEFTIFYT